MTLFALDPWWNDFYTIGGFIAGIIGALVSVGGFWIAIGQIRKTMHAAQAAQEAANRTLIESKESYGRFVGAYATRLLSELQHAVEQKDWKLAKIRCEDLADLVATLPPSGSESMQNALTESINDLRGFRQKFAGMEGAGRVNLVPPKMLKEKWYPLLQLFHTRLDQLRAPFREGQYGQINPNNPVREIPGDRAPAPDEDQNRPSELDEEQGTDQPPGDNL